MVKAQVSRTSLWRQASSLRSSSRLLGATVCHRGAVLVAASLAMMATGCEDTSSGLLTAVCAQTSSTNSGLDVPGCKLQGDVRETTGFSADSIAIEFGPNGGTLTLRINAMPATSGSEWTLDVLAASTRPEANNLGRTLTWGSCGAPCPADPADVEAPLTEDFEWITVVDSALGSNLASPPDDAVVVLRGASMHVIDVRTPGFDEVAVSR